MGKKILVSQHLLEELMAYVKDWKYMYIPSEKYCKDVVDDILQEMKEEDRPSDADDDWNRSDDSDASYWLNLNNAGSGDD